MKPQNKVFIACSLDGYIADINDSLDWLQMIPNPDKIDMAYSDFMETIDAIVMGRKTFETVCSFEIDWPYNVPVFVLSNSLKTIAPKFENKVELIGGSLNSIRQTLNQKGYRNLYIDGGTTIQNFLKEDLIDEIILTTFPILLGGGAKLFEELPKQIEFELLDSKVFLNQIVQNHYRRKI